MANIDWPTGPTVGQTYVFNGITYTWTGTKWQSGVAPTSLTGPTGPAGVDGAAGVTGPTGPTGLGATSAWVLLATGSVASAATLDIVLTSYTAYRDILFALTNWLPATDSSLLNMRFSTDGGATYLTATNYYYDYINMTTGAVAATDSTGQTEIALAPASGNAATRKTTGEVLLFARKTAEVTQLTYNFMAANALGQNSYRVGRGGYNVAQDTDAARFLYSTGNIASGDYAVYGRL